MAYDCDIVANNNTDFVIADNVKIGNVPILTGAGTQSFVCDMSFDIDNCCKNNNLFRTRLSKTLKDLDKEKSVEGKMNLIQNFMVQNMPLCDEKKLDERTACVFDSEPFSYMVENKLCMCAERAIMAQYLCQTSGIKSYLVNSYVNIKNGEKGLHAYNIFENNGKMFVYDPANPTKGDMARIMDTRMDKSMFDEFIVAINENADSSDVKKKNCVGFACAHEDGKMFLYRSNCGTESNKVTPTTLKARREQKMQQEQLLRDSSEIVRQ